MRWLAVMVVALGSNLVLLAVPATGQVPGLPDEVVQAVLFVTPEQARELTTLLRSPGTVAGDLADAAGAVIDRVPTLPAALLHDVVTAPARDWHVLLGVVTDTAELVTGPAAEPRGLFRHTIRALHRSQVFTAAADIVRRVTRPTNRTARLAIVLTLRGQGIPARVEHLDMLARAIDRNDPDVGPLLRATMVTLAQRYGRDAVRLILD
jgi:hypothetical protein